MESDWGCFDDCQSNPSFDESADNRKSTRVKLLEEVIPFNVQCEIQKLKESQQVEQPALNYYGDSEDFWINAIESSNPDIDLHTKFLLDLKEEDLKRIRSEPKLPDKKSPESKEKAVCQQKKGRLNYGRGKEHEKLKDHPNYNRPYDKCYVFIKLRLKTHDSVKLLGKWYNDDFKNETGFVKFSRPEKRKVNIAFWFFQQLLENKKPKKLMSWIDNKIQKLNSINI